MHCHMDTYVHGLSGISGNVAPTHCKHALEEALAEPTPLSGFVYIEVQHTQRLHLVYAAFVVLLSEGWTML